MSTKSNLIEDAPIVGQKYVAFSLLPPKEKGGMLGMKIRGVFGDIDYAKRACERFSNVEPNFSICIGEVGKWLPILFNEDTDSWTQEIVYAQKELDSLMKAYDAGIKLAAEVEEDRKINIISDNIDNIRDGEKFIELQREKRAQMGNKSNTQA